MSSRPASALEPVPVFKREATVMRSNHSDTSLSSTCALPQAATA